MRPFAVAYADQNEADYREFVRRQAPRQHQEEDGAAGNLTPVAAR